MRQTVAPIFSSFFLCCCFSAANAAPHNDRPPESDAKLLQGSWNVVFISIGTNLLPKEELAGRTLFFENNTYVMKMGNEIWSKGTFSLDPTKTPKAMDIAEAEGETPGKTTLGIYLLKDDMLLVCYPVEKGPRPAKLGVNKDHVFLIYKRDH